MKRVLLTASLVLTAIMCSCSPEPSISSPKGRVVIFFENQTENIRSVNLEIGGPKNSVVFSETALSANDSPLRSGDQVIFEALDDPSALPEHMTVTLLDVTDSELCSKTIYPSAASANGVFEIIVYDDSVPDSYRIR